MRSDGPFGRRARDVEVPPPDGKGHPHPTERRAGRDDAPVLLVLDPMHHSDHRLAEQNQSEQTESFGEVRGIRRHSEALTNRQPGRAEVERERDAPEHVPRRGRNQGGGEPQRGRQAVPR